MWCPRFIREWLGAWNDAKARRERGKEESRIRACVLDKLMDKCISLWYKKFSQHDPALLTDREALRKHIRWWSYDRKYNEFLRNFTSHAYMSYSYLEDSEWGELGDRNKLTNEPWNTYVGNRFDSLMRALKEKFEIEIF